MEHRYGWVIVAAGALITCVAAGAMFALPVYLQPMADDTGWSRAGISLAMTIGFLVMGVAGFVWGTITDRIGARPVVLVASFMLVAGLLIASRAPNLLVFQIAFGGLCGASVGAFFAPIMATTIGWFDRHRGLAVSLVSIGGGVAPMVVTPLASVLITSYGWRSAMLITAIGALVILVPTALLIRRAPAALESVPEAAMLAATADGTTTTQRSDISAALRTPQFIILAATFFLCCAAHSGPIFHTVSYAMLCGASALAAASIYSVEGVAGLFGRLLFGVAADRLGVKRVIIAGLVLQAAGIYAYIYVTRLTDFYMLAAVLGMAYGGVMPLYAVLAREYFPAHVMGTVLGAITMTSSIGMAFGPIGGGWIFDTFGDYHWLYVASAAIGLAAAAIALGFPRPARPAETTQLAPA
ncbi:membrane protein [Devosia limi DSM 17137]|uniref:Membrane protein n=1 Tax=Devosia limi DSM 17137 TaxID=1121477 RepID=A0A0F5LVY6_9HYPH|nr:MFS transporter [Devosia limi]KKB86339.1 membrane protein [Devosia limi DSM 17137]SHE93282.1 Sugar phosphate permease [Devosia limi DSM 17137]